MAILVDEQADIYDIDGNILGNGQLSKNKKFSIELSGDSLPLSKPGEKVQVIIRNQNKILITVVYASRKGYLGLLVYDKKVFENRRNFYRIKTNIILEISDEINPNNKILYVAQPISAIILDISLGGLRFGSPKDFIIGNLYRANAYLDKDTVDITFQIIRKEESEIYGNEYGCMFYKLTPKSEQVICKYIFDYERQKIRI